MQDVVDGVGGSDFADNLGKAYGKHYHDVLAKEIDERINRTGKYLLASVVDADSYELLTKVSKALGSPVDKP